MQKNTPAKLLASLANAADLAEINAKRAELYATRAAYCAIFCAFFTVATIIIITELSH